METTKRCRDCEFWERTGSPEEPYPSGRCFLRGNDDHGWGIRANQRACKEFVGKTVKSKGGE